MSDQAIIDAIRETFAPAAEMQRLASKQALSPAEVQKLYGITETRLEKLRAEGRGPQYSQLAGKGGSVLYTPSAIQKWLSMQAVQTRAV